MVDILLILIIVIVLIAIISLLLVFATRRVNVLVRDDFINKTQELDVLIEDKEKTIKELSEQIGKLKREYDEINETEKINYEVYDKDNMPLPRFKDYDDDNFITNYQKIKNTFNFDIVTIVKDFIKNNPHERDKDYEVLKKIRNYFSFEHIYKLLSLKLDDQQEIIESLLSDQEKRIIKKYFDYTKIDIKSIIIKLDQVLVDKDPEINVVVSNKKYNFDYLDSRIKTIYDDKLTEGFKIIFRGKIYDYSI